jgi:hypothetical protein
MSNRRINASELDYNQLKSNLITYMKDQPGAFQDYNFEGSAMNTIIDVLAYITHINSVNANFALNETFLDTAQLRESVVSHAKLLGYTPRSTKSSIAYVNIELNNPTHNVVDDAGNNLALSILRGTEFSTVINSVTYKLMASSTYTTNVNADGKYIFENVKLIQGVLNGRTFTYDDTGFERYIILENFVNTDSLLVDIFESPTSTLATPYTSAPNITNIDGSSEVFFLEESRGGFYEVKFGDGNIGRKPKAGNIVSISYVTVGSGDINGASQFLLTGSVGGNTEAFITTLSTASGGAPAETMDSIKFNAPLGFVAQNRAVTPDDYKGIIQNTWGDVDTLTVWGGEDNIPPDYGKVYISIKPLDGEVLSQVDKDTIISLYLKPKNVVSITPILVDPDYTYISLEVYYKYNPNTANVTEADLSGLIRNRINNFNTDNLKTFDGVFRSSNLIGVIDDVNISIISNITRVSMFKKFTPTLGETKFYEFNFNQALQLLGDSYITSTSFIYNGDTCTLQDFYDSAENKYIIKIVNNNSLIRNHNVGEVFIDVGKVVLRGFTLSAIVGSGSILKINAKPASSDISPMRNELLTIDYANATIKGEVDTMIVGGTTAGIDYNTVSS